MNLSKTKYFQKIKTIVKEFLFKLRFNLSANNNFLILGYYKYLYRPKANSLNAFLNDYSFSKKNNFVAVQIGANDGLTHDPIHKFIKRDNWSALLLEPQSLVYEKYLKQIYKKDKNVHIIHAALGYENGSAKIYKIGFSEMRWATGLASFQKETIEKAFSNGYIKRQCEKFGIEIPDSDAEKIISEEVSIISPATLLEKYKVEKIDLLQIDTEGFDFEIIKMFDIPNTQPKAIIYENTHLNQEDKKACEEFLSKNNYVLKKFDANTLAFRKPVGTFENYTM